MNLMNYHLYANTAAMAQIMAEDTGASELRNPVFYIRTEYNYSRFQKFQEKLAAKWNCFWNSHREHELCRLTLIAQASCPRA